MLTRREFVATGLLAGAFGAARRTPRLPEEGRSRIAFETSDVAYAATYAHALAVLAANTISVLNYPRRVLIEGSSYRGIWMECGPHEGLAYAGVRPDVARDNHLVFFALQRDDGQIPAWVRTGEIGLGQIQMVVPIAATAWELAQQTGDSELLERAYRACSRWDAWLRRYRDTRRTGLCEGFCTYDTGHDRSPRWAGIPNRCPDSDARKCPTLPSMPRLCPDLSANVYGARTALAAMARALGKRAEADRWLEDAEDIRARIVRTLYSEADAAFFDLDAQDRFVRVRGDLISRVLGEHVVDRKLFDQIYQRQIHNPAAFWPAYPLPSIAMDDPAFVRPIPVNSWGGASQALTALRAPRWMEHYGRPADLAHMMQQWVGAIVAAGAFLQQMDPTTGAFTAATGDYSPAALVLVEYTWRLSGVRQAGDRLEWNVRPPSSNAVSAYRLRLSAGRTAELRYTKGAAELLLDGRRVCGTRDTVRLVTDERGALKQAVGIASTDARVTLRDRSGRQRAFSIRPNETVEIVPT